MEKCVTVEKFNGTDLVTIKQPGSALNPRGLPVTKIECTVDEALELALQIQKKLGNM